METPEGKLGSVLSKLRSLDVTWSVDLSLDAGLDGANENNYRAAIKCRTSDDFEIAVAQFGEGVRGLSDVEQPWTASILVCRPYGDGTGKDQLYAAVFDYHEETGEYRQVRDFVWERTRSEREARAARLKQGRTAFFG